MPLFDPPSSLAGPGVIAPEGFGCRGRRQVFGLVVAAGVLTLGSLTGCSKPGVPLDQIVFGEKPAEDMRQHVESFKAMPKADAEMLLAFIVANDMAAARGRPHAKLAGKTVEQVMPEVRQWAQLMEQFERQGGAIRAQILQYVSVSPAVKTLEEAASMVGKAQIMKVRYEVMNRSTQTIAGVRGQMRWSWPDGRQIAAIEIGFTGQFEPGIPQVMEGSSPVLIGSKASKEMRDFGLAQLSQLRFEFRPSILVFKSGSLIQVPTF